MFIHCATSKHSGRSGKQPFLDGLQEANVVIRAR
jgi:hypothetical protein